MTSVKRINSIFQAVTLFPIYLNNYRDKDNTCVFVTGGAADWKHITKILEVLKTAATIFFYWQINDFIL